MSTTALSSTAVTASPVAAPAVASKDKKQPLSPFVKAVAGSAGGAVEALCLQPLDVIKTRLQLDSSKRYQGIIHCARTIWTQEGPKAFYKGLTPFVTHLSVKYALRMSSFAMLRSILPAGDSGEQAAIANFMSGLGAGLLEAVVVVTPFEVVKTRLQQQEGFKNVQYKGPINAVNVIVRQEGLGALWKGVVPTMLRNGTNQACNFAAMGFFNRYAWHKQDGDGQQLAMWKTLLSGGIAGAIGPIVNCPMDVIKTRLMGQRTVAGQAPKYRGFMHALVLIPREEGVAALWRGLLPRLMRLAPGQAIMWTVVTRITTFFEKRQLARNSE